MPFLSVVRQWWFEIFTNAIQAYLGRQYVTRQITGALIYLSGRIPVVNRHAERPNTHQPRRWLVRPRSFHQTIGWQNLSLSLIKSGRVVIHNSSQQCSTDLIKYGSGSTVVWNSAGINTIVFEVIQVPHVLKVLRMEGCYGGILNFVSIILAYPFKDWRYFEKI
jgi:hypothetical protein